jgi:hypothetical protein
MPLARIGVCEALTTLPTTQAMSDFDPLLTFVTDRFREVRIPLVFAVRGPGSRDGS